MMLQNSVKKESDFRSWLNQMWVEHLDELDAWGMPSPNYGPAKYFENYKWWLKREYRFQSK